MKYWIKSGAAKLSLLVIFLLGAGCWFPLYAQLQEPDVRAIDEPRTPTELGFSNRIGASVYLNNFGFALGGTFTHALGPFTELTFSTGITGIRDVSEQSFQNFFTGQQIVPDKFKRALGFPFLFGVKQRIFANRIADNFRFFVAGSGGPAMAFVYPYLRDSNDNGFRDFQLTPFGLQATERINDFFSGWGDGSTEWGAAGEMSIGVDLGSNFKRQSTLEIGFFFYYFSQGLQIMEPFRPKGYSSETGLPVGQEPFFDEQKFFVTPQIKFTYSGWW